MISDLLTSVDEEPDLVRYSGRAKSKSKLPFEVILGCSKALRVWSLFLAYDLLKRIHLVPGLFLIHFISSLGFIILQKPFTKGPKITVSGWISVFKYSVMSLLLTVVWFYGLTLCGPMRTLLVTEHSSSALITGVMALFCQETGQSHSRARGAVFFLLGIGFLLLVDHDDSSPHHQAYHAGHAGQHPELHTFFTHLFSWTDISDHKGGVLLLTVLLVVKSVVQWFGNRASVAVGGARRLNALSVIMISSLISPWAFFHYNDLAVALGSIKAFLTLFLLALSVKIGDFYVEMTAARKPNKEKLARLGCLTTFAIAFLTASVWTQAASFDLDVKDDVDTVVTSVEAEDHQLSPGVIFAIILFSFANLNFTSNRQSGARGFFVGYSSSGLPLYNLTSDSIHEAGLSVVRILRQELTKIVEDKNSRKIFYFLLLNLGFTFVEFAYGAWTNSLGLISDGFHMLFDCSALVMGLYASVLARWKPTKGFSFGYERFEVLSGFINGLFLTVIALNVFIEASRRLFDPPTVGTDRLLMVSVSGLVVNLVGIFAFSHGHSHGGSSHSHGHSHNVNMEGVFLHILADTLGSVGVIVSSLLIEHLNLYIADPICSIFIAVMIFLSVIPLLRNASKILILSVDDSVLTKVDQCLQNLRASVPGLRSVERADLWSHTSSKVMANVVLEVDDGCDTQSATDETIRLLRGAGVHLPTVQVQKSRFLQHLDGLGTKFLNDIPSNVLAM